MNKSCPLAALAALTLAGCASAPFPLLKSDAPNAAKVRIVDRTGGAVVLFPPDDCNRGYRVTVADKLLYPIAAVGGFSHHQAGMLGAAPEGGAAVSEFSIAPGQTVNLGASTVSLAIAGYSAGPACLGVASFIARAGTQYEVVVGSLRDQDRCVTHVRTLSLQDGQVLRTPLRDVRPTVCRASF